MKNPWKPDQYAQIAGETVTTATKMLDQLDLFENDGLVAAVPFGKIVTATIKLFQKISDPKKAVRHSVAMATGACFSSALLDSGIKAFELRESDQKLFKERLKTAIEKQQVDLHEFAAKPIHETEIASYFAQLYFQFFDRADGLTSEEKEELKPWIEHQIKHWLKVFWQRLIEKYPARYASIKTELNQESFKLEQQEIDLKGYEDRMLQLYTSGVPNNPEISLKQLYIEPRCEIHTSLSKSVGIRHSGNAKFMECEEVALTNDLHQLVTNWLNGELNTEKLYGSDQQLLLLYGMPGQGKTSFCKRLLHDLFTTYYHDRQPVYFLRLRRVHHPRKLKEAPLAYLKSELERVQKITVSDLDFRRSLLILDGMDELAMSENMSLEEADSILTTLLDEMREHESMRAIVTSRHGYLRQDKRLDRSLIFQLSDLDRKQQVHWLTWYSLRTGKETLTAEKLEGIPEDSPLGQLLTQPLLLQMVADLDQLPENTSARAEVYQLLFDNLTEAIWKKKQVPAFEKLGKDAVKELFRHALQEMAFTQFIGGEEYIYSDEVEALESVKDLVAELGQEGLGDAFRLMFISFYFREVNTEAESKRGEPERYAIEFAHKSFAEFLAMEYVYRTLKDAFTDKKKKSSRRYQLDDEHEALQQWHFLASRRPFSYEMEEYLREIIKNDEDEEGKDELKERLLYFFSPILRQSFLDYQDTTEYDVSPNKRMRSSFRVWCITTGTLNDVPLSRDEGWLKDEFVQLLISEGLGLPLRTINLSGTNLHGADLRGANLRGANLRITGLIGTNLSEANLSGVYLGEADLHGVDLRGANLRRADLSEAYLGGADLSEADLGGADLSEAYLGGADLSGADLSGAYLRGAYLGGAYLGGADLSGADLSGADLSEAINITVEQLSQTKTLYSIKGLPPEIEAALREQKPGLFKEPE